MTTPFPIIENAVRAYLVAEFPAASGRVGGSASYKIGEPFYIRIEQTPGGGADENGGQWALDIAIFDDNFANAKQVANDLEAMLVSTRGAKHGGMILDRCFSNQPPSMRPSEDPRIFEVGTIYTFMARRKG